MLSNHFGIMVVFLMVLALVLELVLAVFSGTLVLLEQEDFLS